MSNRLTKFYTELLKSCSLSVVDDVVHQTLPDEGDIPVTVKKKTLVIPTRRWLADSNWENLQGFHPMCENVLRKESDVFRFLRRAIIIQISKKVIDTMEDFIHICKNQQGHAGLNPFTQVPLLSCAPEPDDKFVDNFKKLVDKINPLGETPVVNIISLRGKPLKGKDYTRVCRITFPLVEALRQAENSTVYGVKLRKRDIEYYLNLLNFILAPETGEYEEDQFSEGSRSGVAPSLHALLRSFASMVKTLNIALKRFDKETIPFTWEDELADFGEFKGLIPVLSGNDGESVEGEEEQKETSTPARQPEARAERSREPVREEEDRRESRDYARREEAPESTNAVKTGSMDALRNLSRRRSDDTPRWARQEERRERDDDRRSYRDDRRSYRDDRRSYRDDRYDRRDRRYGGNPAARGDRGYRR